MNTKRFLATCTIILSLNSLHAQETSTGRVSVQPDIDFTVMAEYEKAHPVKVVPRLPFEEEQEEDARPERFAADPALVHRIARSAAKTVDMGTGTSILVPTQAPVDTFLAIKSNGGNIPPDTHGDVDATYCVNATNSNYSIQRRSTKTNISTLSLNGFWSSVLPSGTNAFDPRVHYDPHYQRWIVVTDAVSSSTMGSSTLLIAVSATCDPKGTWHRYTVSIDPTNNSWLDYPNVGFNKRWLTVTGNMFPNVTGGASGGVVYVFDYASLMSGAGAPYKKFSQPSSFTLCPAVTYDTTQQNMYVVEVANPAAGQLQLWKIEGSLSSPSMSIIGNPAASAGWRSAGSTSGADFAPQLGSTSKLDAGDNRIHRMVYRNNKLWCAHTVFYPLSSSAKRCAVMWWQIDTLAVPIQNGLIEDPTTPGFYTYPSIAVNKDNDVLIGFSFLSKNVHPSAAYALRMHTDPLDSMRQPYIFRHGQATYFQNFGSGKDRWGDYSAATVDPRNDLDFWTIQESVPASPANYWDTWWAYVTTYPGALKLDATKDTVNVGANDTIKHPGVPQCGATLTWNFDGGTATPGTGAGPQIVKWATTGWKVVTLRDSIASSPVLYMDSIWVKNGVGIENVNPKNEFVHIVPNPNNGNFDLTINKVVSAPVVIKLLNLQGSVVYTNQFTVSNGTVPVATGNLAPGVYIATIVVDNEVINQKMTITR